MQQRTPFLMNINAKFERPAHGLTSHIMSMCSVVLIPHQFEIVQLRNRKSNLHEILNINSTAVALYERHMFIN